jgi:hypothetical protein
MNNISILSRIESALDERITGLKVVNERYADLLSLVKQHAGAEFDKEEFQSQSRSSLTKSPSRRASQASPKKAQAETNITASNPSIEDNIVPNVAESKEGGDFDELDGILAKARQMRRSKKSDKKEEEKIAPLTSRREPGSSVQAKHGRSRTSVAMSRAPSHRSNLSTWNAAIAKTTSAHSNTAGNKRTSTTNRHPSSTSTSKRNAHISSGAVTSSTSRPKSPIKTLFKAVDGEGTCDELTNRHDSQIHDDPQRTSKRQSNLLAQRFIVCYNAVCAMQSRQGQPHSSASMLCTESALYVKQAELVSLLMKDTSTSNTLSIPRLPPSLLLRTILSNRYAMRLTSLHPRSDSSLSFSSDNSDSVNYLSDVEIESIIKYFKSISSTADRLISRIKRLATSALTIDDVSLVLKSWYRLHLLYAILRRLSIPLSPSPRANTGDAVTKTFLTTFVLNSPVACPLRLSGSGTRIGVGGGVGIGLSRKSDHNTNVAATMKEYHRLFRIRVQYCIESLLSRMMMRPVMLSLKQCVKKGGSRTEWIQALKKFRSLWICLVSHAQNVETCMFVSK